MRKLTLIFSFLASLSCLGKEIPTELRSKLNRHIHLPGFGKIAYRAPKLENNGPLIVLFHGIYGGASHRTWRQLLPILDNHGARVYLMDLPGAGDSNSPKRIYTMEVMDAFVEQFLESAVGEPANVVTESILGQSALKVASQRPNLFKTLTLLSPNGINTLANPPREGQQKLFKRLYNKKSFGKFFYWMVLTKPSIKYFLKQTVYNDKLIDKLRIKESKMAKDRPDQKWLTFSFIGGQLYRPFEEASKDVFVPTLGIFGKNAENVGFGKGSIERAEEFINMRPEFNYIIFDECGQSVQVEKTFETAKAILNFAS
ncbi:alpha/beta hydrolase [Bacteriovoracales bacterium]|nr:alpha/beta hydrolase [Bacteriovoracales bacterium]